MSERISTAEVTHVARLARLALTAAELELYSGQLAAVLDLAAQVAGLDTDEVPPTAHPLPLQNVLRDDVEKPCLPRDLALDQAPLVEGGAYFRVPPILGAAS
jgi:aspartyl-tRNA(Asn)/glutamyl-tRNA(Gln) amidotransferase subunit C